MNSKLIYFDILIASILIIYLSMNFPNAKAAGNVLKQIAIIFSIISSIFFIGLRLWQFRKAAKAHNNQ